MTDGLVPDLKQLRLSDTLNHFTSGCVVFYYQSVGLGTYLNSRSGNNNDNSNGH